ncbi:hypothetical protein BDN71DRAFT_1594652 [Pleurotus eryngii]|uniref:Uncharacterized protein n=1 Tax=Pleurotus eryngii TaxID=5323 RepID=A0A9P5ZGI8_PLEER|nr:hypothetical protein BDN71DRAFT_1594652 [Pleurotus eryngii]
MADFMSAEKEQFAVSLLPWYRNAMYKNEDCAFFEVACILFFDRFPPPPSDPMCTKYHLEVNAENFALAVMLYSCHPDHRDTLPSTDDWQLHITLSADRQRRRDEWLAKGSGQPVDYQYIIMFEDEDEFMQESQYMDLEGHIYY